MRKVLAVIAVVAVVCVAGAAFAQTRGHDQARRMSPQLQKEFSGERGHIDQRMLGQRFGRPEDCDGGREFCGMGRGHRGGRLEFAPDMPEEIRAQAVEAAKLRIDLSAALSEKSLNKAKAMEIFAKIQQAENEVRTWRFSKSLERMEAFRTQRELNRNVPPAPPAPKGEAPEE
ncbi:MAG: hypothetical protein IJU26_02690 [Synergistaceae bacterium]|nr:hypothetical protein [Synergistaceae bacterium]